MTIVESGVSRVRSLMLKLWARVPRVDADDRAAVALLLIRVGVRSLVALTVAGTAGLAVRVFGAASGLW